MTPASAETAASATPARAGQPGAGLDSVHHADIFDLCARIEPASVDMILCDLPYGTTACSWDTVIPFAPMWAAFKRIVKPRAAIVLTASQPFTSALVMSNPAMFKHEWIWIKNRGSNFLNTVREPFKEHESVLVFAGGEWEYNPQTQSRSGGGLGLIGKIVPHGGASANYGAYQARRGVLPELRMPSSWQRFNTEVGHHPTQKPVALFAYLIRTYTQPGALVFDPCCGSGTTALAARQEGRHYIVGDSSAEYVAVTEKRLAVPYTLPMLFADAATEAG